MLFRGGAKTNLGGASSHRATRYRVALNHCVTKLSRFTIASLLTRSDPARDATMRVLRLSDFMLSFGEYSNILTHRGKNGMNRNTICNHAQLCVNLLLQSLIRRDRAISVIPFSDREAERYFRI